MTPEASQPGDKHLYNAASDDSAMEELFYELRPPLYDEAAQLVDSLLGLDIMHDQAERRLLCRFLASSLEIKREEAEEIMLHLRANKHLSRTACAGSFIYHRYDSELEEQQMAIPARIERRPKPNRQPSSEQQEGASLVVDIVRCLNTHAGEIVTSSQIKDAMGVDDQAEVSRIMRILLSEGILSPDIRGNELKRRKDTVRAGVPGDFAKKHLVNESKREKLVSKICRIMDAE